MQLGRGLKRWGSGCIRLVRLAPAVALLAAAGMALADVEGATHLTIFREPSTTSGKDLNVIHPQGDVSAGVDVFQIGAGYEMDIVSGATPRVFGPYEGPDAVSAATGFSDLRQLARGSLGVETPAVNLSAGYSYGWESDYRSHTVTAAARSDFLERNFTLGLAYTRNFDSVCDQNNDGARGPLDLQPLGSSETCFAPDDDSTRTRRLSIDTFEPSLAWTATPRLLVQAGGTMQLLDGFQSNPYRAVLVGTQGRTPQERLPTLRQRYALFARAHQAVPPLRASLHAFARAYRDTWDVMAATGEAGAKTYLGSSLIVGARARYHRQTGAVFYRTGADYRSLGPAGAYWTGDRELSPFSSWLFGGELTYLKRREQESRALIEELELGVRFDALLYDLDPGAPNQDRKAATIVQAGLTVHL